MGSIVRSRNGRLAILGGVLIAVVILLVVLLSGGGGGSTPPAASASSPGAATTQANTPTSTAAPSGDANATGPTYSVGSVEDCLRTNFGSDSVSDFPGPQSSIALFHQAATVVDVEGDGEGSQSSTGTLLFFGSSSKAAAALPKVTARYKGEAVNEPNDGSVVFIAGHLAADAQVSVMGCIQ